MSPHSSLQPDPTEGIIFLFCFIESALSGFAFSPFQLYYTVSQPCPLPTPSSVLETIAARGAPLNQPPGKENAE